MTDFVRPGSIVRRIWGDADMVLLIFTGSAAEFALNREVDWLFFTGKLPADPIGRLISTASHARQIVFADELTATRTFERIRAAHAGVERQRGQRIPDWAHRDVLYMLIDYSERAHELLVGPLNAEAKDDLYDVFFRVGTGLGIPDLPSSYARWKIDREAHLRRDLVRGIRISITPPEPATRWDGRGRCARSAAGLVHAGRRRGRARGQRGHRTQRSGSRERRAYDRGASTPSPECCVR